MLVSTDGRFSTLLGHTPDAGEHLLRRDCGRSAEALSAMTSPLRESLRSGRSVAHQDGVSASLSASTR